jgi:acyl carrier protein
MLRAHVMNQVGKALGLNSADTLDPRGGLSSLGMDSLMAVELRSRLQASLGCSLPATLAFEYPNIEAIVDYIAKEVLGADEIPSSAEEGKSSAGAESVGIGPVAGESEGNLDDLSEAEMARLLERKLSSIGREK